MTEAADDKVRLAAILRAYLRETLAADLAPVAPPFGPFPRGMMPVGLVEDSLSDARLSLARRDPRNFGLDIDRLMQRHGLDEELRDSLGIGVMEAQVRAHEEVLRRMSGDAPMFLLDDAEDAPAPSRPTSSGPPPAPVPATPLASALVEPFFKRREFIDKTRQQVMGQERGTVARFIEVAGDRPVSAYGRGDVTRFLDTLRRLPSVYGRSPKDKAKTVADLIAAADAAKAPRLTDKTVKRHLTALSQFLRFARDDGHISNAQWREMVEGHRFRVERGARSQRDAWTPEDLTALFRSPVWTGRDQRHITKPGPHIIRDAKFWLPILALFHGARLEEFADLYRRDVGCDGGVWFFNIAETEANEAAGKRARTLKTENATRIVPMHPELIRLGFVEYVARTAPNADDPLFPDLPPQGEDQRRGARFTRDFRYYREQVGVYRPGVGMHAFRHTAITRLTDAIRDFQQKRHRDYLMGHGGGGTEGDMRYDKGPGLKATAATLALLQFPEVDLSHLHVAADAPPTD